MSGVKNEPKITPQLVAEHGLKPDEYERILKLIGREPTFTELGIFSAMWNEHCSYKSSKVHLRGLPTSAPWVIQGPGENAGVIDIGDGLAVVFKMESHNHPSYIEPYQGAATGVGGILRDVFTMGARPVANLNALRFGRPDHPRMRHLIAGVLNDEGNVLGLMPHPEHHVEAALGPTDGRGLFAGLAGSPNRRKFRQAIGRAPMVNTSRRMPPTPVAAPWYGSI